MAESNLDQAGYLQEHRELRAEIRHHLDWRAKSIQFALLLTAAVVAVAGEFGSGVFFLVTALVIAFVWYDEMRHLVAVFRIATYLEMFVEPRVPGLNSETIGHYHPVQTSIAQRVIANGVFPALYVLHVGLMLQHYSTWRLWQKVFALGTLAAVFIAVALQCFSVAKHGRERELSKWQSVQSQLKGQQPDA